MDSSSPFDLLPDEIVLKIIKLASVPSSWTGPSKHDFLLDIIGMVSPRFMHLIEDKSLWKGEVTIEGCRPKIQVFIEKYLNEDITYLWIGGRGEHRDDGYSCHSTLPILEAIDIKDVADKCPNVEVLTFHSVRIVDWPSLRSSLSVPWSSVKHLCIHRVDRDCFNNIALHETVPNIEVLTVAGHQRNVASLLPDMNRCENLKKVHLMCGTFRMPRRIPFPPGLSELVGAKQLLQLPEHRSMIDLLLSVQMHCPMCDLGDAVRDDFYEDYD